MLRSCYTTQCRFYDGDPTIEDIEWYFTLPDTPFIPKVSCINSLNWVDQSDRGDNGRAGEVGGAPRTYSKGNRDVSLMAGSYCGNTADWLGHGVRPAAPLPKNSTGNPLCCGDPAGPLDVAPNYTLDWFVVAQYPPFPPVGSIGMHIASEWAFDLLTCIGNAFEGLPFSLDLYYANPNASGTNDYGNDFTLCDFPGYATAPIGLDLINPTSTPGEVMSPQYSWQQTGPTSGSPPGSIAMGLVATDVFGLVLFYAPFSNPFTFTNIGDYLTLQIDYTILVDYW